MAGQDKPVESPSLTPVDSNLTGGKRRSRARSPLTRKIISFNLVALSLLVSGILFLDQSRENLIGLRTDTLEVDAKVLATAVSQQMQARLVVDVEDPRVFMILDDLAKHVNARAQLFSRDGLLITDNAEALAEAILRDEAATPRTNTISDIFTDAWGRLAAVVSKPPAASDESYLLQFRAAIARRSILARDSTIVTSMNGAQQLIVTAAVPISLGDEMVGAVVLSTLGGEIDGFVKGQRQQVLEMFILAAFTSIFLSSVLANTIGRPLRELAKAAEEGSFHKTGGFSSGRINIPDLTDRPDEIGDLSRQLRNLTGSLYDRIEANEAFAADVAHELKNPLTSLGSAVETMRYVKDDKSRERLMDVIRDDVNRMDRLVTDISNASRLDGEMAKDEMQEIDLTDLITNIVNYQAELAEGAEVKVIAKLPATTIIISALQDRLAQVLVNLITNAVSFVPKGGAVTVSADLHDDDHIKILVEDTGCGIPEDNLANVFERFYSSRPEQDFGNNSGLGLAISKQIIEAHGGQIWASNIYKGIDKETPLGARFTIILPL